MPGYVVFFCLVFHLSPFNKDFVDGSATKARREQGYKEKQT